MVMSKLAFMYLEKEDWSNCAKMYRKLCTLDGEVGFYYVCLYFYCY